MFAQVVFDLPIDSFFDYTIASSLENQLKIGQSVKVHLGSKKLNAIVIGITKESRFKNLKSIISIDDQFPILDEKQLDLGQQIASYYGCSLGQAAFTIARGCQRQKISKAVLRTAKPSLKLHLDYSGHYEHILIDLIKPIAQKKERVLILVPDQFETVEIEKILKKHFSPENCRIGSRSLVFRSLSDISLVIMIDEQNSSYKQEQTPMYETRHILLMRSAAENMSVAFVSSVPSVEMMNLVKKEKIALKEYSLEGQVKVQAVDLNNYKKLLHGIVSPALTSVLEANSKKKLPSVVILNHHERIEQLKKTLQQKFPLIKIENFRKNNKGLPQDFDILIGTTALLRFKNQLKVNLVVMADIDRELNHLDARSCFRVYSMAHDFRNMAQGQFLIQSRNPKHYVIESLLKNDADIFYKEDMRIRRELGVYPFGHQVFIKFRHKNQKWVEAVAGEFYQALNKETPKGVVVEAPSVEISVKKRDVFRMNILLQGLNVPDMISFIKVAIKDIKRNPKVIKTFHVDP